jgi:ribosomal protein S18 acetylase RimI-like enzyme
MTPQRFRLSASLHYAFALPDDPELDGFDSGDAEVDSYFRSRRWFNVAKGQAAPPTYVFRTDANGPVVGYAAVSFRNTEHPDDQSTTRARYLMVYAVGVNRPFQGQPNPSAPSVTLAASIFEAVETLALAKPDCVGMSLWARATNERALRFYRRLGFVADPGGPTQRDSGSPHLTMRKPLPPR